MKVYFEYFDYRGVRTGYSDDIIFTGMADIERRAFSLIENPRLKYISFVTVHKADNDEEIISY